MEHFKFMSNTQCEFFPCHDGADPAKFNCLFCYCPLYVLGPDCGGDCTYTEQGLKDCTACTLPHTPEGYDYIIERYEDIARLVRRTDETNP